MNRIQLTREADGVSIMRTPPTADDIAHKITLTAAQAQAIADFAAGDGGQTVGESKVIDLAS